MPGRNAARSIHAMLRQSFFQIIAGMLVPTLLLGGLLIGLTQRYDSVIADTSRASELRGILVQELPDEIWRVVSGRISFDEGQQQVLLDQACRQLEEMRKRSAGEETRYLSAALRAAETVKTYIAQLGAQTAEGAAVSRREAMYREIRSVSQLAGSMLDRYIESEIARMGQLNSQIQIGMLVTGALLAALIGMMIWFALRASHAVDYSIRTSIFRLEEMAARIAQGDLSVRVPPAEVEELRRLTGDLNTMAGQIDSLIHERVEQEKTLKKAELRALQAQITPHFMYNTLETIVWLAEEGRNREVVEMTMAFTGFLRISLSRGQDYITVEKEEQHVASYLQIQSVRYGSIMRYEIEIDPSLAGQRMLKLMLQPLVENAIYHGVKRKRGRGLIRVTGWRQGNEMCFAVEDDGLGMTPEQLAAVREGLRRPAQYDPDTKGGYGLRNVEERLRLYYGQGLEIESVYRKGTRVSFRLPCGEQEEENH